MPSPARPPHPNDVDRKRIERALASRARYRYVTPEVIAAENGYIVRSPCCSRNVDADGGTIDIAWLTWDSLWQCWLLHCKDHTTGRWTQIADFFSLAEALRPVLDDPHRLFWP